MSKLWQRLRIRYRQVLDKPRHDLTRAEKSLLFAWTLARHCARQLRKDKASQMAAALTYHTLFSLLPTLVLMLVVAQVFVNDAELERFKSWVVDAALQGVIVEEVPAGGTSATDAPAGAEATVGGSTPSAGSDRAPAAPADSGATAEQGAGGAAVETAPPPVDDLGQAEPEEAAAAAASVAVSAATDEDVELTREQYDQARRRLETDVQQWLDKLQNINFSSIGVAGVLLFVWGATGLLATIERSFNQIYGASENRPWYLRLMMYYTTLTLAPVVILSGQVAQQRAIDAIETVGFGAMSSIAVVLSPVVTVWLALIIVYALLPNTKVRRRPAAIGALVAAVLWVLLITGFRVYATSAATASLYGALALLPMTLLWVWLTWMIVLFGLEVAYALQTMPQHGLAEQDKMSEQQRLFDTRAVVPIMASVGEAFHQGVTLTPQDVGHRLELSDRLVSRVMDFLHEEKLLHRVMDPDESYPRFTLARPPEQIPVSRLLETGTRLTVAKLTTGEFPGAATIRRLNEAVATAAGDTTLADVLRGDDDKAIDTATA